MVARCSTRRGARGDTDISTLRPSRGRLITGALALAVAALVVRVSLDLRSDGLAFVSGTVGLVAVAVLGGALILKRPGWIGPALALLALLYLGHVFATGTSDVGTLLSVSIALLVSGELGQWSLDSRLTGRREMAMHRARAVGLAWLSAAALGTVLVGALALGIQIPGGGWSALVAVAGAVALLGIIARIATSSADAPRTVADTGPSSE